MIEIGIIGLGNWGTALAHHLGSCGHSVLAWSNNISTVDHVNANHKNPECLQDIALSKNITATSKIEEVLSKRYILVVLPSSVINILSIYLKKINPNSIVVSCVKGLEVTTSLTPLQYFEKVGINKENLVVLSGPSFAKDVAKLKPCGIVCASTNLNVAKDVAKLFSNLNMRVYPATDTLGVELGGIVKNVIALAAGISDGLGLGDSAKAGLITRGLSEMHRLIVASGGKEQTVFGLSGLGDLAMTASSDLSRNRTVGLRLGKGEGLSEIIKTLGSVAEAVTVTPHILKLAKSVNVEMPITEAVSKVLNGEATPEMMVKALVGRPMREEF